MWLRADTISIPYQQKNLTVVSIYSEFVFKYSSLIWKKMTLT